MKRVLSLSACLLFSLVFLNNSAAAQPGDLDRALNAMDRAAQGFHSAQADVISQNYQAVVREMDTEKGVMYVRKDGKGLEMALDFYSPGQRYLRVSGNLVQLYQPGPDQLTRYNASKNREAFETFLLLGFGGRGHDLVRQFDVRYAGTERVNGVNAIKLDLIPRSPRVRGIFDRILMWIDPSIGVAVQQQFFEHASGNYRLARYSNIKLNKDIPASVFKLKTTRKTKVVNAR
jgi:outer membrane lipoprotein-sorting protein